MKRKSQNSQMFALSAPPSEKITINSRAYRLEKVFKHDFFTATCLYCDEEPAAEFPKVVVKFGRRQMFFGLPMSWYGRWLHNHEKAVYAALESLAGVPRWAGSVDETSYAIEYVEAAPLDHVASPPAGFFDRLRELFDGIHNRGVAYCDANKRSNILVGLRGQPFLVDYQIAIRRRDDWPWPLLVIMAIAVQYMAGKDIYHLYKHKRRLCPQELTPQEDALSRKRGGFHAFHRRFIKLWKAMRRGFLKKQYQSGRLVSPTENLETHHQPEKETWRVEKSNK